MGTLFARGTHPKFLMRFLFSRIIYLYIGGTPTSMNYTGEQWDYPNAWPPLQSFLILGLQQTGVKKATELAEDLAGRWLRSNYIGYEENGNMFEKVSLFFLLLRSPILFIYSRIVPLIGQVKD